MSFTDDELTALHLVVREEMTPLRSEIAGRFDEIASQIDGLYQRDEKREQEYFFMREQIKRLEQERA